VANPLELADPFPSIPAPIIPVEEDQVTDPDTGVVKREEDVDKAQALARQKLKASSQQMERVGKKITPSSPAKITKKDE